MKKKISIVLSGLLVMCILFCGCSNVNSQGGNNSKNQNNETQKEDFSIIGNWKRIDNNSIYSFEEKGICRVKSQGESGEELQYEYKYEIKPELEMVVLYMGNAYNFDIIDDNGVMILQCGASILVSEDEYDNYYTDYIETKLKEITGNKTKIKTGNTYALDNGQKIVFVKGEIEEDEMHRCEMRLFIELEDVKTSDSLEVSNANLISTTKNWSFSPNIKQQESTNTYVIYDTIPMTINGIKESAKDFILVTFELNGAEFYVDLNEIL